MRLLLELSGIAKNDNDNHYHFGSVAQIMGADQMFSAIFPGMCYMAQIPLK